MRLPEPVSQLACFEGQGSEGGQDGSHMHGVMMKARPDGKGAYVAVERGADGVPYTGPAYYIFDTHCHVVGGVKITGDGQGNTVVEVSGGQCTTGDFESAASARLSFWDALIVATARSAGCARLLTEDLHHGQEIRGVRIVSPFREVPPG